MKMVNMAKICNVIHALKPVLLMVVVQMASAGVNILCKLAANDGMILSIIVAYRFVFASAFMVPLALFVERKRRPKFTWMILLQAFCCGLFGGALAQNFYVKALAMTSATFAAATTNLIPAITFILAVCFGMEKLGWKTSGGAAKIIGTALGVGGAMLLTFYKGVDLHLWKTNINLLNGKHDSSRVHYSSNTVMGSSLAMGSCLSFAIWLIVQARMLKTYPCPYSVAALTSVMGAAQALVFGLCTERNWVDWKLGWNVRFLTVAYSGLFGSGLVFTLVSLCVQMSGPLFVSAFNPLMLVLVAIAGSLVLNESLHLGSVLGTILIVFGLYGVLWGKAKEAKKEAQLCAIPEPSFGTGKDGIDGESGRSSVEVVGESKRSSVRSVDGGARCIEVIMTY